MLTVSEALALVLEKASRLPVETVPLAPATLGLVLAEDVASDLDMPPYDKALMDGYAVRAADLPEGNATLSVIEEITAGTTPTRALGPGQASRIMTGAPLPFGADAVVVVERTQSMEDGRVLIEDRPPRLDQNLMRRAGEMKRGERVLLAGTVLRPQEIGLLAAIGRTTVKVYPPPRVAVLPTGDEIVPIAQVPGPGQIRNSNGPMLLAQVVRAGGIPHALDIARDRFDSLRPLVAEGLQSSILVLSGGVSAGTLDLVPAVLQELGVEAHFHKVEMKPGKPIFFGTWTPHRDEASKGANQGPEDEGSSRFAPRAQPALVFGLPGNPVSSLVCFELFVRPAIRRMRGQSDVGPSLVQAALVEDVAFKTDRPTYHPAWLEMSGQGWRVRRVPWLGSTDLRGLTQANALAFFPPGDHRYRQGETCTVVKMEE